MSKRRERAAPKDKRYESESERLERERVQLEQEVAALLKGSHLSFPAISPIRTCLQLNS